MTQFPYRDVFNAVEQRLLDYGSKLEDSAAIRLELDKFKHYPERHLSDTEYFEILVMVTFYSGFKAATVKSKKGVILKHFPSWKIVAAYTKANVRKIMSDPEMICHEGKIRACVKNAKTFVTLVEKYGSMNATLIATAHQAALRICYF